MEHASESVADIIRLCEPNRTVQNLMLHPEKHYRYTKLKDPTAQIRLLKFTATSRRSHISASLTTWDLDYLPPYTALSYEWGAAIDHRTMTVNGRSMIVRKTRYSALNQMFNDAPDSYFWIDAICIDQFNNREKSHQVQLMGEVYSRASNTAICLGDHDESSRVIFGLPLSEVRDYSTPHIKLVKCNQGLYDWALEKFGNRRYWTRLWIVQEVLLSQNTRIFCGLNMIPWETLEALVQARLLSAQRSGGPAALDKSPMKTLVDAHTRVVGSQARHEWRLDRLLGDYGSQGCSDPRDKVYGLLGLAEACSAPRGTPMLTARYGEATVALALRVLRFYRSAYLDVDWYRAAKRLNSVLDVRRSDSAVIGLEKRSTANFHVAMTAIRRELGESSARRSIDYHHRILNAIVKHFRIRQYRRESALVLAANKWMDASACNAGADSLPYVQLPDADRFSWPVPVRPSVGIPANVPVNEAAFAPMSFETSTPIDPETPLTGPGLLHARREIGSLYCSLLHCLTHRDSGVATGVDGQEDCCVGCFSSCQKKISSCDWANEDVAIYLDEEDVLTHAASDVSFNVRPLCIGCSRELSG